MKFLKFSFFVGLILSLGLFTGCGDDEEPVVSPFVGNYIISKAVLTEALTIPIVEIPGIGSEIVLPADYDITAAIQASLLNNVDCDSPDKSWIELREDKSMYMSCESANELNAGTWEEVSATELKLNMNSSAVPPQGFVLNVTDIVQAGNSLSGKTSVPLPQAMITALLPQGINLAPDAPQIFMAYFSLDFTKK